MSHPIGPASPHAEVARRFAAALRAARLRRGVGTRVLAEAARVSRTLVCNYEAARNIPSMPVAIRIAEALGDHRLAEIAREARVRPCARCRGPVVVSVGRPARYCGPACADAARRTSREDGETRRHRAVADDLRAMRRAVAAMCATCSDGLGGACTHGACPLRPVSPLPLVAVRPPAEPARPRRRRR